MLLYFDDRFIDHDTGQHPVGDLGLEQEDYARLTEIVVEAAKTSSEGRVVLLLEGGYHLDWLPRCVLTHLESLDDR